MSNKNLSDAISQVILGRKSTRAFKSGAVIPKDVIRSVLKLTQSSPSSFNLQPYKLIIVQSISARNALSTAMLGPSNVKRVQDASLTVVFAADKDPSQITRRLMNLERDNGTDPSYIAGLPSKMSFLLGKGILSKSFRLAATHLMSPLRPSPVIPTTLDAWASKNAALAAGTYMIAAEAHGLATAPMEGFDERRVGYVLGIPTDRYCIPLIISTGYSDEIEAADGKKTRRFPLSEVVCMERFDEPYLDE